LSEAFYAANASELDSYSLDVIEGDPGWTPAPAKDASRNVFMVLIDLFKILCLGVWPHVANVR